MTKQDTKGPTGARLVVWVVVVGAVVAVGLGITVVFVIEREPFWAIVTFLATVAGALLLLGPARVKFQAQHRQGAVSASMKSYDDHVSLDHRPKHKLQPGKAAPTSGPTRKPKKVDPKRTEKA